MEPCPRCSGFGSLIGRLGRLVASVPGVPDVGGRPETHVSGRMGREREAFRPRAMVVLL